MNKTSNAALMQPSARVVEAINMARVGKFGNVTAAKTVRSKDIIVTANIPATEDLLEQDIT